MGVRKRGDPPTYKPHTRTHDERTIFMAAEGEMRTFLKYRGLCVFHVGVVDEWMV